MQVFIPSFLHDTPYMEEILINTKLTARPGKKEK